MQNIPLPAMTQSSSAVDTSTGTVPAWDVSDAEAVTISFNGTTTAPGPQVQVAYSLSPTATFTALTYQTSGAGVVITSSTIAITIHPVAALQMRVVTTSIRTGPGIHTGAKQIIV